jgi:hypothetical protein
MLVKKYFRQGAFLVATAMLSLTACKHDNNNAQQQPPNVDENGGYASDYARMEQNSNDVISISDAAYASGSGAANLRTTQNTIAGCATITNDTMAIPHVLTIDFGTNCTGLDGKVRSGEIIIYYTGHYKDSGSAHTITFNNYYVNGNQVTGSQTVTNMGNNSSGQVYYNIADNDTLNLGANNGYISWQSHRVRTWVQGYNTAIRIDDVYSITGNATLTRANGHVFTFVITSPLLVALDCPWIKSGVVTVTASDGSTATLDYGNGNCDSEAQLTINGHTYNITLSLKL